MLFFCMQNKGTTFTTEQHFGCKDSASNEMYRPKCFGFFFLHIISILIITAIIFIKILSCHAEALQSWFSCNGKYSVNLQQIGTINSIELTHLEYIDLDIDS